MKRLILPFILLTTGCMSELEQRVKRLEGSLNDVRSFQAEQTTQISYLQGELRKLTGKTEEIEYTQAQKYGTDLDMLKQDLSNIKRRVPPPANVPLGPLEEDESLASKASFTPFTEALLTIRQGNYTDAITKLQELLQTSNAETVPHVLFWLGVSYDGQADYKQALQQYHELTTKYPQHRRAPLALLRQASVFEKIGDSKAASATIDHLIDAYPDSSEAIQLKSRFRAPEPKAKPTPIKKKR